MRLVFVSDRPSLYVENPLTAVLFWQDKVLAKKLSRLSPEAHQTSMSVILAVSLGKWLWLYPSIGFYIVTIKELFLRGIDRRKL